jgi:hypothetical protein
MANSVEAKVADSLQQFGERWTDRCTWTNAGKKEQQNVVGGIGRQSGCKDTQKGESNGQTLKCE